MSTSTEAPHTGDGSDSSRSTPSRDESSLTPKILLLAVLLFLPLYQDYGVLGDGQLRYLATVQIVDQHQLPDVKYSILGSLFLVPFYLLGKMVGAPLWWCARAALVCLLLWVPLMAYLLRGMTDDRVRWTFLLLVVTASLLPAYANNYSIELVTLCLVSAGLLAVCKGRTALGWSAAVVATVTVPVTWAGLITAAAALTWRERRWRHLLAPLAAACLILVENWIRRGSPFVSGYENEHGAASVLPYSGLPGFSYPLFFGVLSVLFSFGRGLVFFFPGLLLSTPPPETEPMKTARYAWCAYLAGLVVVYSRWYCWYGAASFGPRYFIIAAVPACYAIAVRVVRGGRGPLSDLATAGVLLLSAWTCLASLAFQVGPVVAYQNQGRLEYLVWYIPEYSNLWYPFLLKKWDLDWRNLLQFALVAISTATLLMPLLRRVMPELRPLARTFLFKRWPF